MSRESFVFVSDAWRARSAVRSTARRIALYVLALLGLWAVTYALAFTALPGMLDDVPFRGIAPDAVFLIAALLLISRGLSGERGWALIGVGALCSGAGDIY
jgi:hypothetical protein